MDINFQSSVAAKGGRAGTHKPQCRRSTSGPSRNYDGHTASRTSLVYPTGAIRVGQRGSCRGCDVSDSVVALLWRLPSSLNPDSALGVSSIPAGLGGLMGWEPGWGRRG